MAEDMKYFVHLKDNVVFAWHESATEIDVEGDNIIQVPNNGEEYLKKKYVNGNFVDAEEIKYAILDENNDNTVISIEKTFFSSDVKGPIITDPSVKVLWKWNGSSFVEPVSATIHDVIFVDSIPVTTSTLAPAVTEEELTNRQNNSNTVEIIEGEVVEGLTPEQTGRTAIPAEIIQPTES